MLAAVAVVLFFWRMPQWLEHVPRSSAHRQRSLLVFHVTSRRQRPHQDRPAQSVYAGLDRASCRMQGLLRTTSARTHAVQTFARMALR